jgi:hypothetical protein
MPSTTRFLLAPATKKKRTNGKINEKIRNRRLRIVRRNSNLR